MKFSRLHRWSPHTNKQKEWLRQVIAGFERDFNWDTFKPQLQVALENLPADARLLFGIPLKIDEQKKADPEQEKELGKK